MASIEHDESNTHHLRSRSEFAIRYSEFDACQDNDFPMAYPWESFLEPESHPISLMLVKRDLEIGYCHSGSGVLLVEDRLVRIGAGCVTVVGGGACRMSRATMGNPSFWSWFWLDHRRLLANTPDGEELLALNPFRSPDYPYAFFPREYGWLCQTGKRMIEELKARRPGHRTLVKGLACAFLAELLRTCRHMKSPEGPEIRTDIGRIAPALSHMAGRYDSRIDVEDLAARCGLSEAHFRRVFLRAIGRPPLEYLAHLRVRMAMAILTECDHPISQIATDVGFRSINTFNRQFRAVSGTTPKQWRSSHT